MHDLTLNLCNWDNFEIKSKTVCYKLYARVIDDMSY